MIIVLSIALAIAVIYIVVDLVMAKLTKIGGFTIKIVCDDDDRK